MLSSPPSQLPEIATSDLETSVLTIWRHHLKVRDLGVTDNFFDAGGHSLLAMTTILEIESQLGLVVSLDTIFSKPTVREFCASLMADHEHKAAAIVPIKGRDSAENRLFYIQSVSEASALQSVLSNSIAIAAVTTNRAQLLRPRMNRQDILAAINQVSSIYAEAIFAQQPKKPFCLAGHSFDGILAVETACRLEELGSPPTAVFLFDTFLHRSLRRIFYEIAHNKLLQQKFRQILQGRAGELRKRTHVLSRNLLNNSFVANRSGSTSADELNLIFREVGSNSYPGPTRPLSSELVLFQATRTDMGRAKRISPNLGWARHLKGQLTMVPLLGTTHEFSSLVGVGARSIVAKEVERRFFQ